MEKKKFKNTIENTKSRLRIKLSLRNLMITRQLGSSGLKLQRKILRMLVAVVTMIRKPI